MMLPHLFFHDQTRCITNPNPYQLPYLCLDLCPIMIFKPKLNPA